MSFHHGLIPPPACRSSGFAGLEVPLPAVAQEYVDHGGLVWKVYVAGQQVRQGAPPAWVGASGYALSAALDCAGVLNHAERPPGGLPSSACLLPAAMRLLLSPTQVFWTQRRSTPDLRCLVQRMAADPEGADAPASIGFDSLKSLPTTLPWLRRQQQGAATSAPAPGEGGEGAAASAAVPGHELLRRPTFEAVAEALRARLGLTLFGFDLVFDPAAGELVIIDVNYFPSFKGIPEAPVALQAALRERYVAATTGHERYATAPAGT